MVDPYFHIKMKIQFMYVQVIYTDEVTHPCFLVVCIFHYPIVIEEQLNVWIYHINLSEHVHGDIRIPRVSLEEITMEIFVVNIPVF